MDFKLGHYHLHVCQPETVNHQGHEGSRKDVVRWTSFANLRVFNG